MLILLSSNPFIGNDYQFIKGYDLNKPDLLLNLPEILIEVSGLTDIDKTTVACVQDEKGIVFIYDLVQHKIIQQYTFNIDGDYEGITKVGNALFILRSDGTLFEIEDYKSKKAETRTYSTNIPAKDNEGLCFDASNNRLLIACKSKAGKGADFKDKRAVYGFNLTTKTTSKEPVFEFDVKKIKAFSAAHNIELPTKTKKSGPEPDIKFRTSAIAVHPLTHQLYALSAADYLLFVFNMEGAIEHVQKLNPSRFNKAEGITFFENGDMIISNEGEDKRATLLRFNYRN